ncbi:hypothetical protein [Herbaspirillum sp. ST 5-3]|uniref:hypothetical protein n=1 Tax=Oxalobacteraceae TaxID=75682 RepID=UPI0010A3D9AF|nr:hypothetical protein [Herbaspirillum sp. ST 5-3]
MSVRTVIEINHDYIKGMDAEDWEDIKRYVLASYTGSQHHYREVSGIRVLGSRHHSEVLKLVVK